MTVTATPQPGPGLNQLKTSLNLAEMPVGTVSRPLDHHGHCAMVLAVHDQRCSSPRWCRGDSIPHCDSLIKKSLSLEALGFIAVCFSCDELINSVGLSGLHPTLKVPARAGRPITGVRLKGSQANAHAGAPNARPGRARPRREARASPPTRAPTCGRSAPRA